METENTQSLPDSKVLAFIQFSQVGEYRGVVIRPPYKLMTGRRDNGDFPCGGPGHLRGVGGGVRTEDKR